MVVKLRLAAAPPARSKFSWEIRDAEYVINIQHVHSIIIEIGLIENSLTSSLENYGKYDENRCPN